MTAAAMTSDAASGFNERAKSMAPPLWFRWLRATVPRDLNAGRFPHLRVAAGNRQPRRGAAQRARACGLLDSRKGGAKDPRLLAGRRLVEPARVALAVPHPLPAALLALGHDLGVMGAEIAVERHGGADVVAVEHLH